MHGSTIGILPDNRLSSRWSIGRGQTWQWLTSSPACQSHIWEGRDHISPLPGMGCRDVWCEGGVAWHGLQTGGRDAWLSMTNAAVGGELNESSTMQYIPMSPCVSSPWQWDWVKNHTTAAVCLIHTNIVYVCSFQARTRHWEHREFSRWPDLLKCFLLTTVKPLNLGAGQASVSGWIVDVLYLYDINTLQRRDGQRDRW